MENTDAKETLRFAIFSGITDTWYLKDPTRTRDAILEKILEPHFKWAVEELTSKKETTYTQDQVLDLITTFNLSTSFKTVEEAKNESPRIFSSKRRYAQEWMEALTPVGKPFASAEVDGEVHEYLELVDIKEGDTVTYIRPGKAFHERRGKVISLDISSGAQVDFGDAKFWCELVNLHKVEQTNPALDHLKDYYLVLQVMANRSTTFAVHSESTRVNLRNLISEIEGKDGREVQEENETEAQQQYKRVGLWVQSPYDKLFITIENILKHGK